MKIAVVGAGGKMGREVCKAISGEPDFQLVCAIDPRYKGLSLKQLLPEAKVDLNLTDDLRSLIHTGAEVLVDFTNAGAARGTLEFALRNGIHAVVGTTGFNQEDLDHFQKWAQEGNAHCLIAPNFSIGAILMMKCAAMVARYMGECEIIELHHPQKLDAPSGTAIRTASLIAESIVSSKVNPSDDSGCEERPSRGEDREGIRIHSVRLPGLVAHQEVIFGSQGQTLSIRHDTTDRSSFMPGVILALRNIEQHPGLTVGLENWLDI